jgi:putative ABC transport system substrate-binding protein
MNRRNTLRVLAMLCIMAGPHTSLAQQPGKVWRVGFLTLSPSTRDGPNTRAFVNRLRELGYIEGKNLVIEWRFADGDLERLAGLAADLVRLKVDVIVAVASAAIGAAQKATATIPIVMASTGDPVGSGFVKSLARPGGNITGLSNLGGETGAKMLDLLFSTVPNVNRLAVLVTPTSTTYRAIAKNVQDGARKAGVKALIAEASTPKEIDEAFSMMARENADALIVGAAPFFAFHRQKIVDLANSHRLPSMFGNRLYAEAGGLMSYGHQVIENYLRAASYVDRILKGANPADLPVEQPVILELVVNMKTAKALGLTIPQSILLRADEVIN